MSEGAPVIDPAVVELLREFEDSCAGGLRGDRADSLATALLGGGLLPRPASALTRALEQSFQETTRHQAGRLLQNAALQVLMACRESSGRVWTEADPPAGTRHADCRPRAGRKLMRLAASSPDFRDILGDDAALIAELFSNSSTPTVGAALRLSARALMLAPNSDARNTAALANCLADRPRTALCILQALSRQALRPELQRAIRENTGFANSLLGNHLRAAAAYRSVSKLDPSRLTSVCAWLLNSVQASDAPSSLEAAEFLEESIATFHGSLTDILVSYEESRRAGHWHVKTAAIETMAKIDNELGPMSKQVTNVLQ